MLRVTKVFAAGFYDPTGVADSVILTRPQRQAGHGSFITTNGAPIELDPQAPEPLRMGDALALDDGRLIEVVADARRPLLAYGALVLEHVIDVARPKDVVFSALGVREGLLYAMLSNAERRKDPLIAAAEELNVLRSRAPAHGEEAAEEAEEGAETFVDVPPMTVNLRTADGASRFLKVHLMLVPGKAEAEAITKKLPLVIDSYQPFLRELRPEDLSGSAATFRIKEELLVRGNAALGAGAVRDVLIQDLVQQ